MPFTQPCHATISRHHTNYFAVSQITPWRRANHAITPCTTLTPSRQLFCCFINHSLNKGSITPSHQPLWVLFSRENAGFSIWMLGVTVKGDYHDVYLAIDDLLLADVFKIFRNTYLEHYKLGQPHFYRAPGLAWQALLKTASEYCEHEVMHKDCPLCLDEFRLELLTDINMLLMFEKGVRSGITQTVKCYDKANNK